MIGGYSTADLEVMEMEAILEHNVGFDDQDPSRWLPYAIDQQFRPMRAVRVLTCPDCGREPIRGLGRYVTFSTLVQLMECPCGLLFANARVDQHTTNWFFEAHAYHDEQYYAQQRAGVFRHLAGIISAQTRDGGRVLDIGGAGGQFASVLYRLRPDLDITVQDVSTTKVNQAIQRGFAGIVGKAWMDQPGRYDCLVLSDSIYYEPELGRVWSALEQLRGGSIVLRVPNRVPLVKLASRRQAVSADLPVKVHGHNPDHLVIGSRAYYTTRLRQIGCTEVRTLPTPIGEGRSIPGLYHAAVMLHQMSGLCITPSMVIVGR